LGPEVPGQLMLWLVLALNILAGVAFLLSARGKGQWYSMAIRAYYGFGLVTLLAVIDLYYLFFSHNYAFKYVYEYSERSQPFFYIVSAFWGGQAGTYLLWLFLSALCGFLILKHGGRYRDYGMAFFSLVNLFFIILMLKVSPFALLNTPAIDGLGLNPLLRDPWMVIHPPVIFVGYALCGVPFVLALAAMVKNDYSDWVTRVFPWVAGATLFLGAGNILGGYWAYKTLGWGGYWAWDPVENSSLVPWIVSVALLHGLLIEKRTGALRKTNLLMSAVLFVLVVYGTFLTRSGVLSDFSVHSFIDLGINISLIVFMALYVLLTLVIFFWRARSIKSVPLDYNYFGKEFVLFASMAILSLFAVIVLFWSSLPILSSWFSDEPRAAEIATYNSFAIPLSILMAFLVTVAPILKFSGFKLEHSLRRGLLVLAVCAAVGFGLFYFLLSTSLAFALMFTLVVGGTVIYLFNPENRKPLIPALITFALTLVVSMSLGVRNYMFLLFLATAAMALVANLIHLFRYIPDRLPYAGASLTHFGFGIMLIGIMASSAFDSSDRLIVELGETATSEMYGVTVGYEGMANHIEHPNNELLVSLDEGDGPRKIRPQFYYSRRMDGIMRRPFISRSLGHDLYLAPQQIMADDDTEGSMLRKEVPIQVAGLTFTFLKFDMANHENMGTAGMSVTAVIEVSDSSGDSTVIIRPALAQGTDDQGHSSLIHAPAKLSVDSMTYQVDILQISADQGIVVLDIPGLINPGKPDKLIVDLSKKPLIVLVWIGTTLILLGSLLSVYRRRTDMVKASTA